MTSTTVRSEASKTSASTRDSASSSASESRTIARISSAETASRLADGSPPSSRTTRFVDTESSQITGRMSVPNTFSGGPTIRVRPSAFCMARRLGASSPSTSERNAMISVMTVSAVVLAAAGESPTRSSTGASAGAIVEAP